MGAAATSQLLTSRSQKLCAGDIGHVSVRLLPQNMVLAHPNCSLASLSTCIQWQASPAAVKAPMPFRTPLAPPPAFAIIATFDPRAIPPAARPLH